MASLLNSMQSVGRSARCAQQLPQRAPSICTRAPLPAARKACVCQTAATSGLSNLGVLTQTRPIDRMRYQAKMVFDTFDLDRDGGLSLEDLQQYIQYSDSRLGQSPALKAHYDALVGAVSARPAGSQFAEFEEFVDLMRAQVATMQKTKDWAMIQLPGRDLSRLLFKAAITVQEMGGVLATFRLLDRDGDNLLKLEDLKLAQGIEKKVVEDVLEDADENDDGFLTFEDFLTSYQKERPVFMSMAVMAAHTACFWMIFQLPIDTMLKVVIAAVLVLKPQLITGPVVKVWTIGRAVWGRIVATREMASKGASWSSIA